MSGPYDGLGWPEEVVKAAQRAARERQYGFNLGAAVASLPPQQQQPPAQNHNPFATRRPEETIALLLAEQRREQAAVSTTTARPPLATPVITIHDLLGKDYINSNNAFSSSKRSPIEEALGMSQSGEGRGKKRRISTETGTHHESLQNGVERNRQSTDASNSHPLAGPFVNGILSGRLLEGEYDANIKRALSNIIVCCSGGGNDLHLTMAQAEVLAGGFVTDRNRAVTEAVRIASAEIQKTHDEIMSRKDEKLTKERTRRKRAEERIKDIEDDDLEREDEVIELKDQAKAKDKEIASLKRQLKQAEADPRIIQRLQDENASLEEKLKLMESRQARSMSALKEASVHSLRVLQRERHSPSKGEAHTNDDVTMSTTNDCTTTNSTQ